MRHAGCTQRRLAEPHRSHIPLLDCEMSATTLRER